MRILSHPQLFGISQASRKVSGVMSRGYWFSRAKLEESLQYVKAQTSKIDCKFSRQERDLLHQVSKRKKHRH